MPKTRTTPFTSRGDNWSKRQLYTCTQSEREREREKTLAPDHTSPSNPSGGGGPRSCREETSLRQSARGVGDLPGGLRSRRSLIDSSLICFAPGPGAVRSSPPCVHAHTYVYGIVSLGRPRQGYDCLGNDNGSGTRRLIESGDKYIYIYICMYSSCTAEARARLRVTTRTGAPRWSR